MRSFMRWVLSPFVRFAWRDYGHHSDTICIGQLEHDPTTVTVSLQSRVGMSLAQFDCNQAAELGQALSKAAYYASDEMLAPGEDE
jgi:hypothetical protein